MSTITGFDPLWGNVVRRVAVLERRKGVRITLPITEDSRAWLQHCADELGVRLSDILRKNAVEIRPAEWRQEDHGELEDALERALEVDAMETGFARTLLNTIDDFIRAQVEEWWNEGSITVSRAAELLGYSLADTRTWLAVGEDE
jgi:hypothetical protein